MSSRRKRAKQTPKKHLFPFIAIVILFAVISVTGTLAVSAYALAESWLEDLPGVEGADSYNIDLPTTVYASDGTTKLAELYVKDRQPVAASKVSPYVFAATVAIEDERFWKHNGVDPYGIARAAWVDLTSGARQGASTITQQFIRQTILIEEANDISFRRKVREAALAIELEKVYSKEEVLMMYLNTINYGDGAWGIQAAAQHYFSKDAADLSIAEAALLCGIPQTPTHNNPVDYPDNALARRTQVLNRMQVNGYITEAERDAANATELNLNVNTKPRDGIYLEPYFASYVKYELQEKFDYDTIFKGGLTVYTTIDLKIQEDAETAAANKEASMDSDVEVSIACIDPHTGYIKAMRGGKDYYEDQFNTTWQMRRQPGSTFKVFALVATLEAGISPSTQVSGASPVEIDVPGGNEKWVVHNFGGANQSVMSVAQATYRSSNTAYARIVRTIGAEPIVDVAYRMGIHPDREKDGGPFLESVPSIVLGSQGVNTLEMASAFGTLAADGKHVPTTAITKIVNNAGETIYEHTDEGEQVIAPEVAYATTEILKGVVTGGTATGAQLDYQVSAGKTGTSSNSVDSMYVGYTPQLSTAVWIGARSNREIADNVGGTNCAPVWRDFMERALEGYEVEDFTAGQDPAYTNKATFMTPAEQEEARKAEEEEKKKQEEELKKNTDTDVDGFSDWDEEQAGTDPADANDYPGKLPDPIVIPDPGAVTPDPGTGTGTTPPTGGSSP
ncbi:MAG: PBP1A family penicillin-binding protein [Coriobacteriales bacterium]|jgi:penicillin-binding protein 1A|nr:PBP1A family penicillin-binding protein [Coriobacteriales bacterium]